MIYFDLTWAFSSELVGGILCCIVEETSQSHVCVTKASLEITPRNTGSHIIYFALDSLSLSLTSYF